MASPQEPQEPQEPQLGTISFCDRAGFNVRNDAYKAAVVSVLRSHGAHILRRHHEALDDAAVAAACAAPSVACLRTHGNPYFLLLARIGGGEVPTMLFVDKKIQPGYTLPRILLAHGRFDAALFDGTLLEGEMVKTRSGTWVFAINDALAIEGRPVRERLPAPARVAAVRALLADRHTPDAALDPCAYEVKAYEPFTADGLCALARLRDALDYPVRGLFVRPVASAAGGGVTRFLDFDPAKVRAVVRPEKVTEFKAATAQQAQQEPPAPLPPPQAASAAAEQAPPRRMYLRRTPVPDVYDVHDAPTLPAVGFAHVPSLALSVALRAAFAGVPTGGALCRECAFSDAFGKWVPAAKEA